MDTRQRATGLRPRRPLITLCITEVTSWGVLYYAFPILAPSISADTGWSLPAVTAGFSTGLVVSAVAGVPVGRILDRVGPRPVMTTGTLLAIPATLALAAARSLAEFLGAWVLAGLAMSAVLYQPAFAALTRWYGPRRLTALTILTLAAGLASTVYAPITAALVSHLSWRQTYIVLAVMLAVITLPGRHREAEPSLALIRSLKEQGMTIIAVEHVMKAILAISDEVLVLHQGRVLTSGAPATVLSDPRVIEAYLGHRYVKRQRAVAPDA